MNFGNLEKKLKLFRIGPNHEAILNLISRFNLNLVTQFCEGKSILRLNETSVAYVSGLSKIDAFGVGKLLDLKRLVLLFEKIVSQTFGSDETNPENRVIGVEEMKVLSVESWIHQTQTTTEAQQVFSLNNEKYFGDRFEENKFVSCCLDFLEWKRVFIISIYKRWRATGSVRRRSNFNCGSNERATER